ncbi:MAG: hypothetical protein WA668_12250 [Candidatus Cybelea sp.]
MMRRLLPALLAAAASTACSASQPANPPAAQSDVGTVQRAKLNYSGNITWNKNAVRLRYPSTKHARAELSYFGPDGYYTLPVYCKNAGEIATTPHRQWGNPKKYVHVEYWFQAQSAGPDDCSFTAILNNTGSPPIAILKIHITGK